MDDVLCLYHKNCVDGTTAASVFLTKFPLGATLGMEYGYKNLDEILKQVSKKTAVYIIDFSLSVEDTVQMAKKAGRVVNIDHHIGVNSKLKSINLDNFNYVFDNDRCGSSLAWNYFYNDKEEPRLIALVGDKDLWKWRFGDETKHANNYLSSFLNRPEVVKDFILDDVDKILQMGRVISEYNDSSIENLIEKLGALVLRVKNPDGSGNYSVPSFNSPLFQSEIGNIMSKKSGEAVAVYYVDKRGVRISFRSCDGQIPSALALAKILGGGGHELAAGALITFSEFSKMIY